MQSAGRILLWPTVRSVSPEYAVLRDAPTVRERSMTPWFLRQHWHLKNVFRPKGKRTIYLGSAPQPRQDKQQKHKAKQSESGPQG